MKLINSKLTIPFLVGLLHFGLLTYLDKFTFFQRTQEISVVYLVLKAIVFCALILFWKYIFKLGRSYFTEKKPLSPKVKIFITYFSFLVILFLVLWPGIWIWDEFGVYEYSIDLNYFYWQNYFTSIYFILALMFFPFAAGIVLFQLIIISLIVTFIVYDLSKYSKYYWLAFIVFLLPPVIYHNYDPIRISMYAYLLLFVVYYMAVYLTRKQQLSFLQLLPIALVTPFLIIWRAEGLVFLPFIIVFIFLFLHKNTVKKNSWIISSMILIFVICLNNPQKIWSTHNRDYSLTAMLNPLSMMLQEKSSLKDFEKLRPELEKGINLDILGTNPSFKETPAFWNFHDSLVVGKNNADFDRFRNAFVKLVIANPGIFLKSRWLTFWSTSGCINDDFRLVRTANFDLNNRKDYVIELFRNHHSFNKVYFPKTRSSVVNFLEGSRFSDKKVATPIYYATWNLVVMLIVLFATSIISLFKKKWTIVYICLLLWIGFTAIFVTAPAAYFMYYFPIYLVSFVVGFVFIVETFKSNAVE